MRTCSVLLLLATAARLGAGESLTLDAAVSQARTSHPLLAAASGRIAAAESGIVQARLRPNPRLFVQTENWRNWSTAQLSTADQIDTFAYVSQVIETSGKRSRRTALAQTAARRSELERELLDRQIVARVKQAYWAAAGAARIHQAAVENLANFRQIIEYHEKRVREGALAEADLLKVQLEGERLRLAANTAALDAERAAIELGRAMGRTEFPTALVFDAIDPPESPPVADLPRALSERTELKLALQAREEATANLALQRSLAKSDVDVLFGYKQTLGLPTVMGGVQYNLPISNRNQGAIGSAEAGIRIADSDIAAAKAIIQAELKGASANVQTRRAQVFESLPKLRAQSRESAAIAQAAYREGGVDLLRLLDAERVRIETETLYYQIVTEYRQSIAALETAMGASR